MDISVSGDIDQEFLDLVQHILDDREFRKLGYYTQHIKCTRLLHSINVSYIAWAVAKKFNWDSSAAARAGLLHDFFLYERTETEKRTFHRCMAIDHPQQAIMNSEARFELTEKERQAILSHMFPLGPLPTSREAWAISFADKICAVAEFLQVQIALSKHNRVMVVPA